MPDDSGERRVARRVLDSVYIGLSERGSSALQNSKQYDEAVSAFTMLTEMVPDRGGPFFNLSWAYAVKGDKKKSLAALKTAVEKGFSDRAAIDDNRALDLIRDDPQFKQIIQGIKAPG